MLIAAYLILFVDLEVTINIVKKIKGQVRPIGGKSRGSGQSWPVGAYQDHWKLTEVNYAQSI